MRSTTTGRGVKRDAAPGEGAPPIRSPLNFFLLVFALSIPLWLAGQRHVRYAVDDGALRECVDGLLPQDLGPRSPTRQRSSFNFTRIREKRWYIPIVVLMAGVNVAVLGGRT